MASFRGELWFAWHPVRTSRGWKWLAWVFRDTITYDDGTVSVRYVEVRG